MFPSSFSPHHSTQSYNQTSNNQSNIKQSIPPFLPTTRYLTFIQPITTHHQESLCLPQLNNHVLVSFLSHSNPTSHIIQRYTNILSRPCLLYLICFLQRLQRWMAHSQRTWLLHSHYPQRIDRCIQPLPSARSSHPWCINCQPKIQSYRECRG